MTSHKFQRTTLIWLVVLMLGAFALAGMATLGSRAPLPFTAALDLPVAAGMDAAPAARPATGATGASDAADSESDNALGNVPAGS